VTETSVILNHKYNFKKVILKPSTPPLETLQQFGKTPKNIIQHMQTPIIIDRRKIYNPKEFSNKLNFTAIGLGK
ncbi:unnamed protein product, partial [marine sediment metagenome]